MALSKAYTTYEWPEELSFSEANVEASAICAPGNEFNTSLLLDSWYGLLFDSPLVTHIDRIKPFRLLRKFRWELLHQPILKSILFYSSLADRIQQSIFVGEHGTENGPWISEMTDTPIFREYHQWYRTGDPRLLQWILSFLLHGKKMDYEDESLQTTALRSWLEVEKKVASVELPSYVSNLSLILKVCLGKLPVDDFWPKHGPGSVSQRKIRGNVAKTLNMRFNAKLHHAFVRDNVYNVSYLKSGFFSTLFPTGWEDKSRIQTVRHARLKFVRKNVKTARSIGMEPAEFMYAQQAVREWIERGISLSLFGDSIRIDDQSVNQDAAEYGSLTQRVDTIDLSFASDSVSWDLVKKIFPRDYLYFMTATRSNGMMLPNGEIVQLAKYAPMGSALCFPTQSLVYASIVFYAYARKMLGVERAAQLSESDIRQVHRRINRVYGKSSGYEPFRIYGDDIACDHRVTADVIQMLGELGFTVNTDKSFVGTQAYRESCGEHYVDGSRVTPILFRIKMGRGKSAKSFASWIEACNNYYAYGYYNVRMLLIRRLQAEHDPYAFAIPFVTDSNSFGIFTTKRISLRDRMLRYNKKYQCVEESVMYVGGAGDTRKTRNSRWGLSLPALKRVDSYYYRQYWRATTLRVLSEERANQARLAGKSSDFDRFDIPLAPKRVDVLRTRILQRWTPVEFPD